MELYEHQKAAVKFILDNGGSAALFMSMGTGKTLTGIAVFKELRKSNPGLKMLVVCPLSLIEAAWKEDVQKFAPDLIFKNLRKIQKSYDADILAINYDMLRTERTQEILWALTNQNEYLCFLDESSRIKNNRSQTTQAVLKFAKRFPYRIVASGTPAPNVEIEYWPQIHFIKPGLFPGNFYAFRIRYFWLERDNQVVDLKLAGGRNLMEYLQRGWKYALRKDRAEEFKQILDGVSFKCRLEACVDLPQTVDEVRKIPFEKEQRKHYKEMENNLYTEIRGRDIMANIALTKLTKLRQISSGFLYDQDHAIEMANPKIKELKSVLEEIGDQQVIIWFNFRKERNDIARLLMEKKKPCGVLDGETFDKDHEIKMFKNNAWQFLLANPASASHGLTFTNCHYQIFYSLDYSYEKYEQAKARTHRIGQKHSTVYIHLLMEKSIEEIILNVLKRKGKSQDIISEWLK